MEFLKNYNHITSWLRLIVYTSLHFLFNFSDNYLGHWLYLVETFKFVLSWSKGFPVKRGELSRDEFNKVIETGIILLIVIIRLHWASVQIQGKVLWIDKKNPSSLLVSTQITAATWSINNIVPVFIALKFEIC